MEKLKPVELLRMFDIDPCSPGGADWVELAHRIAAWERWHNGGKAPIVAIVSNMCDQRQLPQRAFYARMRRAIRPLLEADERTLAALGIFPEKKTTTAYAKAAAEFL